MSPFWVFYHYHIIYNYTNTLSRCLQWTSVCLLARHSNPRSCPETLNCNLSFFSREVFSRTNHCRWLPSGSIALLDKKMASKAKNHRNFFNKSNYMLCSLCILPSFFRVHTQPYTQSGQDELYNHSRVVFSFRLVFLGDKIFLIYEKNSVYFLQQSCPLFVAFASRPGHRQKSVNT